MTHLRALHLRGALGVPRTEMWEGREHLVVPVVALQEAVIHAVNAKTPEYVSTSSLAASVGKWNGHPLVVGHPMKDGKQCSAHSPEVLARHGFGFIRSSAMNGTRLGMEAMVDPARLVVLKQDQLLADLRAGKGIEVSVGAFVNTNDTTGTFGGKNYNGEWMDIGPDHLAFLPNGVGACSMAMGCGAHRAAMLVTAEGFEVAMTKQRSLRERFNALVVGLKTAGIYDTAEQQASEEAAELVKWQAMRATHDALGDAWDEVDDLIDELIEAEANHVVGFSEDAETEVETARLEAIRLHLYSMNGAISALLNAAYPMPTDVPHYLEAFRAAYGKTISAKTMKALQSAHDSAHTMHDHTTALGVECKGIKGLAAKDCPTCDGTGQIKTDDKQADCTTCDGSGVLKTAATTKRGDPAAEGDTTMTPEQKAAALKALSTCGCDEAKIKTLDSDEKIVLALMEHSDKINAENVRLKALTECKTCKGEGKAFGKECPDCKGTGEIKAAEALAALKAAEASQIPAEELASLRALADERKQHDAAQKTDIVSKLKTAQAVYTEAELNDMPLAGLLKLAQVVKIEQPAVDYSGRGTPRSAAAVDGEDFTPPNPFDADIKALQGKGN